jgi:hypothetical protein
MLLLIAIHSQDNLRHPLKDVDLFLAQLHQCHNDPTLRGAFLMKVAVLPAVMARIFVFMTVVSIIHHVDSAYVDVSQAS